MELLENNLYFSRPQYLFLASEARSGSTYFANTIEYSLHETMGGHFWDLSKEKFANSRLATFNPLETAESIYLNPHGFRCSKLLANEISVLFRHAVKCSALSDIMFGSNTYWIIVRRRNRIRQAISQACAIKSGVYHFYDEVENAPDFNMEISDAEIMESLNMIAFSDIYLENLPLILNKSVTVFYEDFMQDKKSCIENVFIALGLPYGKNLKLTIPPLKRTNSIRKEQAECSFLKYFLNSYGISEGSPIHKG